MSNQQKTERLATACWENNVAEVTQLLQQYPPTIVNSPNSRGQSPLYCACRQGHFDVVMLLVNYEGINLDTQVPGHEGTPLHACAFVPHADVVLLMLLKGANPEIKNKLGLSGRQEAAAAARDIFKLLDSKEYDELSKTYPRLSLLIKQQKDKDLNEQKKKIELALPKKKKTHRPPGTLEEPSLILSPSTKASASDKPSLFPLSASIWNDIFSPSFYREDKTLKFTATTGILYINPTEHGFFIKFEPDSSKIFSSSKTAPKSYGFEFPSYLLLTIQMYTNNSLTIFLKDCRQLSVTFLSQSTIKSAAVALLQSCRSGPDGETEKKTRDVLYGISDNSKPLSEILGKIKQGTRKHEGWNQFLVSGQQIIDLDLESDGEVLKAFSSYQNPRFCWAGDSTQNPEHKSGVLFRCHRPLFNLEHKVKVNYLTKKEMKWVHPIHPHTLFPRQVRGAFHCTRGHPRDGTERWECSDCKFEICYDCLSTTREKTVAEKIEIPELTACRFNKAVGIISEFYEQLYVRLNAPTSSWARSPIILFDTGDIIRTPSAYVKLHQATIFKQDIDKAFKSILLLKRDVREKLIAPREFASSYESSSWTNLIQTMYQKTWALVDLLQGRNFVLLEGTPDSRFSDSIIAVLAQLILDESFRTPQGFLTLLIKDFFNEDFFFFLGVNPAADFWAPFVLLINSVWLMGPETHLGFTSEFLYKILDTFSVAHLQFNDNYYTFVEECCDIILMNTESYSLHSRFSFTKGPIRTLIFPCLMKNQDPQNSLEFQDYVHHLQSRELDYLASSDILFWVPEFPSVSVQKITLTERFLLNIPVSMSKLSNVKELRLSENLLGIIPSHLSQLTQLTLLDLSKNRISDFPLNHNFPSTLTSLNLDGNNLTNFDGVVELQGLKYLFLDKNKVSYFPPVWPNMTSLVTLNINDNLLPEIPSSFYRNASSFKILGLSGNNFIFLHDRWSSLTTLTSLSLARNQFPCLPDSIGLCTSLKELTLSRNKFPEVPKLLSSLTNLESLHLEGQMFTRMPEWFVTMTKMQTLSLKGNKLSSIPMFLGTMKRLRFLDLSENEITRFPRTLVLDFRQNPIKNQEILQSTDAKKIYDHLISGNQNINLYQSSILLIEGDDETPSQQLSALTSGWKSERDERVAAAYPRRVRYYKYKYQIAVAEKEPKKAQGKRKTVPTEQQEKVVQKVTVWHSPYHLLDIGIIPMFINESTLTILTVDITDSECETRLRNRLMTIKTQCPTNKIFLIFTQKEKYLETYASGKFDTLVNSLRFIAKTVVPDITIFDLENDLKTNVHAYLESCPPELVSDCFFEFLSAITKKPESTVLTKKEIPVVGAASGLFKMKDLMRCIRTFHSAGRFFYVRQPTARLFVDVNWLIALLSCHLTKNYHPFCGFLTQPQFESLLTKIPRPENSLPIEILHQLSIGLKCPSVDPTKPDADRFFFPDLLTPGPPLMDMALQHSSGKFHLARVYKFTWLPRPLWRQCMICAAKLLTKKKAMQIQIFDTQIYASLDDGTTVFIDLTGHPLDPNQLLANAHTLTINVWNAVRVVAQATFANIVSDFTFEFQSWVNPFVSWQCFARVGGQMISIENGKFDDHIAAAELQFLHGGIMVELLDIVPEHVFIEYQGPRYPLSLLQAGKKIGQGGFGTVYLGDLNGRAVAIKQILLADDPENLRRAADDFRKEVVVQGKLKHPCILECLGICMMPLCIITEFCRYGELYHYIHAWNKPLSWQFRLKLASDMALGLQYLQKQDPPVAHIDLKSPNIFLVSLKPNNPVCCKIADFGTSQAIAEPITGSVVDNPVWQAPEMLNGEPYDCRVDTYSYGVILWELLTRENFFGSYEFQMDIVTDVVAGKREQIPPNCPPLYSQLTQKCWNGNPAERPNMEWVLSTIEEMRPFADEYQESFGAQYDKELAQRFKNEPEEKAEKKAAQVAEAAGLSSASSTPRDGRPRERATALGGRRLDATGEKLPEPKLPDKVLAEVLGSGSDSVRNRSSESRNKILPRHVPAGSTEAIFKTKARERLAQETSPGSPSPEKPLRSPENTPSPSSTSTLDEDQKKFQSAGKPNFVRPSNTISSLSRPSLSNSGFGSGSRIQSPPPGTDRAKFHNSASSSSPRPSGYNQQIGQGPQFSSQPQTYSQNPTLSQSERASAYRLRQNSEPNSNQHPNTLMGGQGPKPGLLVLKPPVHPLSISAPGSPPIPVKSMGASATSPNIVRPNFASASIGSNHPLSMSQPQLIIPTGLPPMRIHTGNSPNRSNPLVSPRLNSPPVIPTTLNDDLPDLPQ